jgi:hypothetical protein
MLFASATWLILYQLTDSVAAVLALASCAGGRPTAGGRLLLRPISQDAWRKSRAGAVMMGKAKNHQE